MNNSLQQYLTKLNQAADWGLSDERKAWLRAINYINEQTQQFLLDNLLLAKAGLKENAHQFMADWFTPLYNDEQNHTLLFELTATPQLIWESMFYMNQGIFGKGGDPLGNFLLTIPSEQPMAMPLLISPQADGWGIKEKE